MDKLLELAERCEAATGPDRELDDAILLAIRKGATLRKERFAKHEFVFKGGYFGVPHYTASLDAAMTLIDADIFFHVSRFSPGEGGASAHVYPNRGLGDDYEANAATPALALCAAALRARAAQEA